MAKNHDNIICGIDIGNFAVKVAIASISDGNQMPNFLSAASSFSKGLRKGTVVDFDEVAGNIKSALTKAQNAAGVRADVAYVAVNGVHIGSMVSHGVVVASRPDSEIVQADIDRLIDAASTVSLSSNREIIHRIPKHYVIDGQELVKNALGMKGVRIEADVLLVQGIAQYLHMLAQCVQANDLDVAGLVYSPLALSHSVLDRHMREHGVMSLDLGETFSTLSVFHEGDMIHSATFPIGSRHITYDLAVALRIPMDRAEILKCKYGSLEDHGSLENIDLSEILGEDAFIIPKKQITKIMTARADELFDKINDEIRRLAFPHPLPCGVILSGGGAKLKGMLGYSRHKLNASVYLGNINNSDHENTFLSDPSFAVATGLVYWGASDLNNNSHLRNRISKKLNNGFLRGITKIFKNIIP